MKQLNSFVLKKIQETSRQYIFLTQQLEMILPTELLHKFQVCGITEKNIKICLNSSADHTLIRFYLKNIRQKCAQIYKNNQIRIVFSISPNQEKIRKIEKPKRKISEQSRKFIKSFAKTEMDNELKAVFLRLANAKQ